MVMFHNYKIFTSNKIVDLSLVIDPKRAFSPRFRSMKLKYLSKRAVHTRDFAICDCHPGVYNKLITVYAAIFARMIRWSLSSTLLSVKHILQDVNRKAQNCTFKQSLKLK